MKTGMFRTTTIIVVTMEATRQRDCKSWIRISRPWGYQAGVKVLPTVRNTVAKADRSIPGVVQMTTEAIGEKTSHGAI